MAYRDDSATVTAAQIAAGATNAITVVGSGFGVRALSLVNGTNVTVTVNVFVQHVLTGNLTILQFTATAVAGYALVSKGIGIGNGLVYTRTFGNELLLDTPCDTIIVQVTQNVGAASGSVKLALIQQG